MKTIQELYNEVMASEELKAQIIEATRTGKTEEFLKEHGCDARMEEVAAFLKEKSEEDTPLSMDELENSAGGTCNSRTKKEIGLSIGLLGVGCLFAVMHSASQMPYKHVGQRGDEEGRLCNSSDGSSILG